VLLEGLCPPRFKLRKVRLRITSERRKGARAIEELKRWEMADMWTGSGGTGRRSGWQVGAYEIHFEIRNSYLNIRIRLEVYGKIDIPL